VRPSREDIVEMLQHEAERQQATPAIDPVFVERLDRRLRSIDLSTSRPARRRFGRVAFVAIVAATASAGVAAAAAAVISWQADPAPPSITQPTQTAPEPVVTTTLVTSTTVELAAAPTTTIPTTTIATAPPVATSIAPPTAVEPTTVPATIAITSTSSPTPTTEVRVAATLTLACAPSGAAVECTWDVGPPATTHYVVLRTEAGSTQGRAFTPDPGATTYLDTLVTPGTTYSYLVHALDDSQHSLGHSDRVAVACCG
jgi:hypothetical protein